jgi:hypothetical protein
MAVAATDEYDVAQNEVIVVNSARSFHLRDR